MNENIGHHPALILNENKESFILRVNNIIFDIKKEDVYNSKSEIMYLDNGKPYAILLDLSNKPGLEERIFKSLQITFGDCSDKLLECLLGG